MNRILNRPMFRMGGSSGTGITSGLDQQPRKPLQQGSMPNFQFGGVPGFLTSFGLNLLATPPRGNIFQTSAVAARDPFNRLQEFQTRRALTQAERDFEEKKLSDQREFKKGQQDALIKAQREMSEAEIEAKAAETDKLIASREKIAGAKDDITVQELATQYLGDYDGDLNKATNKARFFLEVRPNLVASVGATQIGGIIEADLQDPKAAKRFANQNKNKIGKVFFDISTGQTLLLTKDTNNNLGFVSFEAGTTLPGQATGTETDADKILDSKSETEEQKKKRLEKSFGFYLPDVIDRIQEGSDSGFGTGFYD
tara:strand:- start:25 stop:960 length:936 start_codon:yes stop_codon:yes gene_type:complete